jgi:hypothetical protein
VTTGLKALRAVPGVLSGTVFGQTMNILVREDLPDATLLDALNAAHIVHADIRPIAPSLEDVFVALTAGKGRV